MLSGFVKVIYLERTSAGSREAATLPALHSSITTPSVSPLEGPGWSPWHSLKYLSYTYKSSTKRGFLKRMSSCPHILFPSTLGRASLSSSWVWAGLSDSLWVNRIWWQWPCVTSETMLERHWDFFLSALSLSLGKANWHVIGTLKKPDGGLYLWRNWSFLQWPCEWVILEVSQSIESSDDSKTWLSSWLQPHQGQNHPTNKTQVSFIK